MSLIGRWLLSFMLLAVMAAACGTGRSAAPAEPTAPNRAFAPIPTSSPIHMDVLTPCVEDGYCGVLEVGGTLLAAAWLDDERMYLTDIQGRIRLLNVETGEVAIVLEGLSAPQGLTVLDGRLYVSDLGNYCELTMELNPDESVTKCIYRRTNTEKEFLSRIDARILSYRIDEFGGLDDQQVAVDRLPARDIDNSPNGLANDGEYVYASVGSVLKGIHEQQHFEGLLDGLGERRPRMDLSGSIARFRPPENEVEVYASGFRNTYGISIAPDGTIYGADNDDQLGKKHLEELNAIVEGGFYGFPDWGTNEAPPEENVIDPVAVIAGSSSTYAYANDDGVYVAYWRRYDYTQEGGYVRAVDLFDYETWMQSPVFRSQDLITSIMERRGMLYLPTLSGNVHVIDPRVSELPIYAPPGGPFRNNDYVSNVISSMSPIVQSGYEVYLDGRRLLYAKSSCSEADQTTWFFLHVVPVDPNDLGEGRAEHGFDNLDFTFVSGRGWRSGGICFVLVELPEYEIREIDTGQTVLGEDGYTTLWDAEYRFER